MRKVLAVALAWGLAAASAPPAPLSAQDFDELDDEFDAEFDEPAPAPAPAPSRRRRVEARARVESDDPFDDAFDDEETLEEDLEDADDEADFEDAEDGRGEDADEDEVEDDAAHARAFGAHDTFAGPTGGIHVVDGGSGPRGSFRVQLATEFMSSSGFLAEGAAHDRVGGTFSASWTPFDHLELYFGLDGHANNDAASRPNLVLALGDTLLGAKVFGRPSPWLAVGGDVGLLVPTSTGTGVALDAMQLGFRADLSFDLRGLEQPKPFIARVNMGYVFDNSRRLAHAIERQRYADLEDPLVYEDETRHLLTAVERYALDVNRTDFFDLGLGLELPLEAGEDFSIHPMLEWTWRIPVNRQGYSCLFVPSEPGAGSPAPGEDGCLDREGPGAFPMSMTLGVRVLPPVRGLSGFLAADIGLTGDSRSQAVRELAANEPWRIMIGLGYAYEIRESPPPEVIVHEREVEVEIQQEAPHLGRVRGIVVVANRLTPVEGAVVELMGHPELSALSTGADGRFVSYQLPPGEVQMSIVHPEYDPIGCATTLPEGGEDVEVLCELPEPLVAVEESSVVILEQINFALDSDEILPSSFGLMQQIARSLQANPEIRMVEIQGHTDDSGTPLHNQDLSQRRADSVMRWLVQAGVAPSRLSARGYGQSQPVATGSTEEARARNRRVEFRILERTEP